MNQQKAPPCLRRHQVCELIKASPTTLWRLEKKGQFPKRRQLSTNTVVWLEHEVRDWILSRPFKEENRV